MMMDHSKLNATNLTFLTAFSTAVEFGHVRIVELFFSEGLKLQELKRDRYKPITLAATSGCLAMVELIVQEGCEIQSKDDSGWNTLYFASHCGHYQVIERLLSCGVPATARTSRKESPLLLAVKGGHCPVAERLLRSEKRSSLPSLEDEHGQQPVHHTVRTGSLEIFELLVSNGGKINVENAFGWQPLHIATAYGHIHLVERFLQQGAAIEEKLGSTSIKKYQTHRIVEEGYWAEARWPYPGSRVLQSACEFGREQIAQLLISKGAKMDVSCGEGWQPLHHATYFGFAALKSLILPLDRVPHQALADFSKERYNRAVKFATMQGKGKGEKKKKKKEKGNAKGDGEKGAEEAIGDAVAENEDHGSDDGGDAGSVFSLGEYAELGGLNSERMT
ncbi:MAG: hypothetical protein Q9204_002098 [Flavoplaca sp. TL-2023a]